MCIDGISGGVSGVSSEMYDYMEEVIQNDQVEKDKTYDGIWVFSMGRPSIYLLSFGKKRTNSGCKNLCRHIMLVVTSSMDINLPIFMTA